MTAARRAFDEGAGPTVVIGADSPTLPASHVVDAFARLRDEPEAVAAPADDGGYVLVGLSRPLPILFHDVPWGSPRVFRITVERARAGAVALHVLPSWYDVDDAASLERLRRELRGERAASRAPATTRFLRRLDRNGGPVV